MSQNDELDVKLLIIYEHYVRKMRVYSYKRYMNFIKIYLNSYQTFP